MTIVRQFQIFADYFQFYVADAVYQTDTGEIWDRATTERMLALGPDLIAIGTARNMEVPVEVHVLAAAPEVDTDLWEQVIDCGLHVASGAILVFGCTQDPATADPIPAAPGAYAARVSYAGLRSLSDDGLDGDDRYRVQLWPGAHASAIVVKARSG